MIRSKSDIGGFAIVPDWIVEADVPPICLRLWCVLARFANRDDVAFPSSDLLCERLGGAGKERVSEKTLRRALADLQSIGAIEVVPCYDDSGRQTTNRYFLRFAAPASWRDGEGVKNALLPGEGDNFGGAPKSAPLTTLNETQIETTGDAGEFALVSPASFVPWWTESGEDPLLAHVAATVMGVPKFARHLPDGPDRAKLSELVATWLSVAPGEVSIRTELEAWSVYNLRNKAKGGSRDAIAALRNWFSRPLARWETSKLRGSRSAPSSRSLDDTVAERLRRLGAS